MTHTVNRTPIDLNDPADTPAASPVNPRAATTPAVNGTHPVRDLNDVGDTRTVGVTVVIPSRNESDNVQALLEQLAPALNGMSAEIMFVDDSDDETPAAIALHAKTCPVPVRLLQRAPGNREGGLSGAVIAGARQARGGWIMVMDADLQHPPESAAALARTAMRHDVDIIAGTRYAGGGTNDGLNSIARVVTSSGATRLAKLAFPRRLAQVSDPMSGLFAWRASSVNLDRLNPVGWKLLLELLVRNPEARVAEMAYEMAPRHAGTSKASMREGLAFLRHMVRLRRKPPVADSAASASSGRLAQLMRVVAVGMIGVSGIAVNTAALWLSFQVAGLHHLVGAVIATQASTIWNFLLIDSLVYRRKHGTWPSRLSRFLIMNNLLLLVRLPVLELLVLAHMNILVANAATLVALFAVRFLIGDRVIYGGPTSGRRDPVRLLVDPGAPAAGSAARKRSQYLKYRYDIAGTVTIGSQILLPELEFFRAQWIADGDVDIAVRVGDVGPRRPRKRTSMTEYEGSNTLVYQEHLGRLGANFRVELGNPINITVGPLLARSPHVVYTNIIEALLRFVMVSRGKMLLHSATISLDGVGVMLSARTDTGKTATILRLLRDHGGRFLSDDMTVVDENGNASCFPKPLTISAHTLRAVNADDLTKGEWRKLKLQSRLHSAEGRSIGMILSKFNVPIMAFNALTQMIIPPPKYTVDRLVPCRMGSSTKVDELFIIERGTPKLGHLDHEEAIERMIENTDDAYGFPPFRYLAPAVTINGQGYNELRAREKEILSGFLSKIRTRTLASDTFGWADEIPELLKGERAVKRDIKPIEERSHINIPQQRAAVDAWPQWDGSLAAGGMA